MNDETNPVLYDLVIQHYNSGEDRWDEFNFLCTTRALALQKAAEFAQEYAGEDEGWPDTQEEQIEYWFSMESGDGDTYVIIARGVITGAEPAEVSPVGYRNWHVELSATGSVSCTIDVREITQEKAQETAIDVARLGNASWQYEGVDDESIEVVSVEVMYWL
jgi:hypothetical protein